MCIYVKFIPIYVFMQRFHYFFSLEVVCLSRLLLANKFYICFSPLVHGTNVASQFLILSQYCVLFVVCAG